MVLLCYEEPATNLILFLALNVAHWLVESGHKKFGRLRSKALVDIWRVFFVLRKLLTTHKWKLQLRR